MNKYFFYFFLLFSVSAFSQSKKLSETDQKALNSLKTKLKSHNLTLCGFLKDMIDIEAKNRKKSEQTFPNNLEKSIGYADKLNKKDKNIYFKRTGMNQSDATLTGVFIYFSKVENCN